jgi:RNA polymerase sigma-70 factor (ECF subfamily)
MTDAERFEAVYREYRPKVLDYIRSHVRETQDAEDLCSEVFRKVLEHMAPDKSGVSSYIYTITRNTVVDYYRTHRMNCPLDEDLSTDDGPEAGILSAERLESLAGALRRIPEREKDIIVLHYFANNTLQEISDKMALPYSVVKRAHQSALRHLRALLEP